nr:hypothetical protein [Lachnospiraceae bacterium]
MKKTEKIVLILAFGFLISGLMLSNVRANAEVETPNVLSGTAVKVNNTIYYRIQNSLYQYDTKSKEIKQLCSIDYEISSIRKYGA